MLHITMLFTYRNDLKLVNSFITVDRLSFLELAFFSPNLMKSLSWPSTYTLAQIQTGKVCTCLMQAPAQPPSIRVVLVRSELGCLVIALKPSHLLLGFTLQSTEQNTIPLWEKSHIQNLQASFCLFVCLFLHFFSICAQFWLFTSVLWVRPTVRRQVCTLEIHKGNTCGRISLTEHRILTALHHRELKVNIHIGRV